MSTKVLKLAVAICVYFAWSLSLDAQNLPRKPAKSRSGDGFTSKSEFRFRQYGEKDGLLGNNMLLQDSLGFVWVWQFAGASRFDGYEFKSYKYDSEDSLTSALNVIVGGLSESNDDGSIWLPQLQPTKGFDRLARYDWKLDGFVSYKIEIDDLYKAGGRKFRKDGDIIWVATRGSGLYSFNLKTKEVIHHINGDSSRASFNNKNSVLAIRVYQDSLLVGTREGLWIFDKQAKSFHRPVCRPEDSTLLYHLPIFGIANSRKSKGNYWLNAGHDSGFVLLGPDFSYIHKFKYTEFVSHTISKDKNDIFWFGTTGQGLYRVDPRDGSITNYRHVPGDPYSLASDYINDVLVDRDQNIWVSTDKGISVHQETELEFKNFNLTDGRIEGNSLMIVDNKEKIVFVSKDTLRMASLDSVKNFQLEFKKVMPVSPTVRCFWRGKDYFWFREGGGLRGYPLDFSGNAVSTPTKFFDFKADDPNKVTSINSNSSPLWEDTAGNLWVGSATGLSWISATVPYGSPGSVSTLKYDNEDANSKSGSRTFSILQESDTSAWVVSASNLDLISGKDVLGNGMRHNRILQGREILFTLFKASSGKYYLGTVNGLYEGARENGEIKFNLDPLWGKARVNAIQEDEQGRLWLYSEELVLFDPMEKIVVEFNSYDGIDHTNQVWLPNTLHRSGTGMMVSVDLKGFSLFDPSTFKISRSQVNPVLTRLLVNNQPSTGIRKTGDGFAAVADITVLKVLSLDYKHNNFSIEFSAMEMTAPERNRYRYKLEGYDPDWVETDFKSRVATYTNLDPGDYVFKVKASNRHGVWSDIERSLSVSILPPPWRTWWAYSIYGMAFISLMLVLRRYDQNRLKLKHHAEHLSELDTLKTQFFTNISHEFRTPITLVLGPLKEMYNKARNNDERSAIGTMMKNGERLLRLINQLLDLSKLEAGKMKLRASSVDVVQLLKEISASYESLAEDKKITYVFNSELETLTASVDQEKIEKIVHNLLSNAFKFTPKGGEVTMHLTTHDKEWFQIRVEDSGIGISPDQQEKIFHRFYQVDSSGTRQFEGSGLGMALAKELVEIHHGKISVESTIGKGTTFTVQLPIVKTHFEKDEIVEPVETRRSELLGYPMLETGDENRVPDLVPILNGEQPVVLIVEDHPEMRRFIRKIFEDSYHILEAGDGKDGLAKAEQAVPDLIISDVMMPEMDGFELCHRIKSKELTSHIPVILLTAKADHESKLIGLQTGADDYLSKPFDADELKLIVRNRLEEIRKLRERFSREITLEPRKIAISSLDEKFLAKVLDVIEVHMGDELFSIEALSQEVGYSNMHFYRKIKALAGQTPSVFLRTIRLKRAAELLKSDSDKVTQIAYSVGFSSLSYFITCFKDQYGVTPGQYAESDICK